MFVFSCTACGLAGIVHKEETKEAREAVTPFHASERPECQGGEIELVPCDIVKLVKDAPATPSCGWGIGAQD